MSTQWTIVILIVALFVGWMLGVLFYAKYLDKPETTNQIRNVRTRGRGNAVSFTPEAKKRNFELFKKISNRRKAKNQEQ